MSSGYQAPNSERVIHQDFIARIRFSNALPPPPVPPKLLDIPNTGLSSGQYTNPGFASRLAREQPLNIEVDAELGMPLDLVGMPGVFDGDESSIQPPAQQPPIHPHDRMLLRPLTALGKPKVAEANVSFLRRTEYISSLASTQRDLQGGRTPLKKGPRPRRAPDAAADSPAVIKRKIDKSFELAEQYLKEPKRVKHPSKKNATLVDARPLLPDVEAMPDSGAYVSVKFLTNPVQSSNYDTRLLKGIFRPVDKTDEEEQAFAAALEAHEQDPANNPRPQNFMNYEYYIAQNKDVAQKFNRKLDVENPERDNDSLYTHSYKDEDGNSHGCFEFEKLRAYETASEIELTHENKYDIDILIANNDDEGYPLQKALYYYPVMQKIQVRPQRTKNIARRAGGFQEDEEAVIHQMDVTVGDPEEQSLARIKHFKENPMLDLVESEDEEEAKEVEPESRRRRSPSGDRDEEVDEDDE